MNASEIKARLLELPEELADTRRQTWMARQELKQSEYELELGTALLLGVSPPQGKNADERKQATIEMLSTQGDIIEARNVVTRWENTLAHYQQAQQLLEDELSVLRNMVRLIAAEMVMMACGTPEVVSADAGMDYATAKAITEALGHHK